MDKLKDKVSVITGAGSGMGKAMALLFASEGSKVIAADINPSRLDQLKKEAGTSHLTTILANMAIESDIQRLIDEAVRIYGTLDILVNNAGIMDHFAPVGDLDDEMWEKVLKINLDGPMKAMRAAIKVFLPKKHGVIINIASIGGISGARAGAAYTTSKHGLIGLTKNTGYIYATSGIRCNAIAPGGVNTNISDTIDNTKITPFIQQRIMSGMVINPRMGEPDEIAKAALFLASDDSSFVNGEVLVVDGGWTAY
jgi:NAD(P)-dependent dehydrogenase (short-subunit alcohol dehydrogenase family)